MESQNEIFQLVVCLCEITLKDWPEVAPAAQRCRVISINFHFSSPRPDNTASERRKMRRKKFDWKIYLWEIKTSQHETLQHVRIDEKSAGIFNLSPRSNKSLSDKWKEKEKLVRESVRKMKNYINQLLISAVSLSVFHTQLSPHTTRHSAKLRFLCSASPPPSHSLIEYSIFSHGLPFEKSKHIEIIVQYK